MSDTANIMQRLAAAQRAGAVGRSLPAGDTDAIRFALQTRMPMGTTELQQRTMAVLPQLILRVERLFPDADDSDLARFFRLEVTGVTWSDAGGSPFDLAYLLRDRLDLVSAEPEVATASPDDANPRPVSEGPVPEGVISDWFGCFKDEANLPPGVIADKLWALQTMRVPEAWAFSGAQGRPDRGLGIGIGQPDTGVADHDELGDGALDLLRAFNIFTGTNDARDPLISHDPLDQPGHGTGTSSVCISRETLTIAGTAPLATLAPIRCIESVIRLNQVDVAKAIDHARRSGCHVITMSLGGVWSFSLHAALTHAVEDNVIVLAAAGNCVGFVVWPARFDACIAIAGTNIDDEPWIGSCSGDDVEVSAPGEFVWRAVRTADDVSFDLIKPGQGTSFAVALTAGVAALWLAHWGRDALIASLAPGDKLQDLFRRLLKGTARQVPGLPEQGMGSGVVDALALLQTDPFTALPQPEMTMAETPEPVASLRTFLAEIAPIGAPEAATAEGGIDDALLERYGQEITWRAIRRVTGAIRLGAVPEAAMIEVAPRSSELSRFISERAPWLEQAL